jgi:NADP-dependent 3-hydroxy acid dehydrogenase YdfG
MSQRTWFITGVSSGFGRQVTDQLLGRGDCVVGTVRDTGKVTDLLARYPESFHAEVLDVTDTAAIRKVVERSFARLGHIDVIISNAGYTSSARRRNLPTSRSNTLSRPTWSGQSS